jgi:hypothetical protein
MMWDHTSRRGLKWTVIPVLLAMLVLAGASYAEPEEPWDPGSDDGVPVFGGTIVDPADVGGDGVDAYQALEPDITVYLTSGAAPSPSEQLSVETQPAFDAEIVNPF